MTIKDTVARLMNPRPRPPVPTRLPSTANVEAKAAVMVELLTPACAAAWEMASPSSLVVQNVHLRKYLGTSQSCPAQLARAGFIWKDLFHVCCLGFVE